MEFIAVLLQFIGFLFLFWSFFSSKKDINELKNEINSLSNFFRKNQDKLYHLLKTSYLFLFYDKRVTYKKRVRFIFIFLIVSWIVWYLSGKLFIDYLWINKSFSYSLVFLSGYISMYILWFILFLFLHITGVVFLIITKLFFYLLNLLIY